MKFRSKSIITDSIIIFRILLLLMVGVEDWTLPIIIWVLAVYIIALIFWYNNYIELDDICITQYKCNYLFKKSITKILYKDIAQIEFGKNHTLSSEDVWNDSHYITSLSWDIMKIRKIFHLKRLKKILSEKKYLMTQYWNIYSSDEVWDINIKDWETFYSNEWWFINLNKETILISRYHDWKHDTLNIKYANIKQIEVVILWDISDSNGCCYLKLKDQDLKEAFYGIKDCNAFMNALKIKGINAHFVSSDEIITDLKDEDLY